nr:acylphosphatase-1 isoform X1 [Macaca nemestrina]
MILCNLLTSKRKFIFFSSLQFICVGRWEQAVRFFPVTTQFMHLENNVDKQSSVLILQHVILQLLPVTKKFLGGPSSYRLKFRDCPFDTSTRSFLRNFKFRLSMAEGDTLLSVDYEIFGKVQGVFFRKYTQAEGKKLGLVGWVQNTDRGTVQGQLQGPISKVRHMQEWLETRGSPKSHIDKANFNNEKVILKLDYSDFQIVK